MSKLALFGGDKACNHEWPAWPIWGDEERAGLMEVLESGKWWYGRRVAEFERKYAAFQDARFGVTTSSGTTALEVALRAFRIGAGDEVIVPAYTFVATATAVVNVGAVPVFADISPDSLCMDPADAERKITPRTRAIMPVHLAGHVADMDAINALARKHNLRVIEDACHSWGSKWNGRGTGALGDCGVFSFQASKNINSAEGGIILTNDEYLADICRSLTNCGRLKGAKWYEHGLVGSNVRLTEFQAALLLAQLGRLEEHMEARRRNALILNDALRKIPHVRPFGNDPRITRRAYHLYCFQIDEQQLGITKQRFLDALVAEGVPASGGYLMPLYRNLCFQPIEPGGDGKSLPGGEFRPKRGDALDFSGVRCPVTERVCREVCWFTHAMLLADEPVIRSAAAAVAKVIEHARELKRPPQVTIYADTDRASAAGSAGGVGAGARTG